MICVQGQENRNLKLKVEMLEQQVKQLALQAEQQPVQRTVLAQSPEVPL